MFNTWLPEIILWEQICILWARYTFTAGTIYFSSTSVTSGGPNQAVVSGLYISFSLSCLFISLLWGDVRLIPSPVVHSGLHERDAIGPQMTRTEITETDFKPTLSRLLYVVPFVYFTAA